MTFAPLPLTPVAEGSRCAIHPAAAAIASCRRCGAFVCNACSGLVRDVLYCQSCLALPEVNHLEATRARYWGKRDAWTWYLGLLASIAMMTGFAESALALDVPKMSVTALLGVTSVSYLMLKPWARKGLLALPLWPLVAQWHNPKAPTFGAAVGTALMQLVLVTAALVSTRNKLAFRIMPSDEELERLYETSVRNPYARRALGYGILSFFVPFSGVFTALLGVAALRRAARQGDQARSTPKLGLALSIVSVLMWGAIATLAMTSK